LINVVNKKLLKLRDSATNFAFLNNNKFTTILGEEDQSINPKDVKKVVITYGQAYFSLLEKRT
jgi:2-oxoglutarate dehydrogenase complex dehydrogenase (E1) component-like enzyme